MQTGMIANNETLRQIWDGPLKDLVIKLNGEDGPEVLAELKKFNRREQCWIPKQVVEVVEPQVLNLRSTGFTLADWLKAREELHRFFTGETIVLRDVFAITDEQLASTTLMPTFRPAGATNRMAVKWKKKLGVVVYEEADVMKYSGSKGTKEPELLLINRSVNPDADTLNNNAESSDQLIKISNKLWLNLFGWCDADSLYFAITGEHLDSETWTWFPNDRLSFGEVALGDWDPGRREVYLYWHYADYRSGDFGARSAIKVPLKP